MVESGEKELSVSSGDRAAFLEALVAAWPEPVLVFDDEGRIVGVEGAEESRRRWSEVVGATLHDLLNEPVADRFLGRIRRAIETTSPVTLEYDICRADVRTDRSIEIPERRSFEARLVAVPTVDERPLVVWFAREVTDRQRVAERWERQRVELEGLAWTDPLTGLRNRRSFLEVAKHELSRHRRTGAPATLAMIDLDLFKRVNDTGGHGAGDAVLVAVAVALNACGRRTSDLVARLGGEEFALLMGDTDLTGALVVAEGVRRSVGSLSVPYGGRRFTVTASIGLTSLDTSDGDIGEALRRADEALYAAKRAGRDRVYVLTKGEITAGARMATAG